MRLAILSLTLMVWTGPVAAHGPSAVPPDAFWHSWSFDPLVLGLLLVSSWGYGRGTRRLWTRAGLWRGIGGPHILSSILGQTIVVIALISPLDRLGETLLSAHMVQHSLLITAAPLLLLLAKPGVAFAWALPAGWSRGGLAAIAWRPLARAGRWLSRPLAAAMLQGLTLWIWHAPGLFDAAVEREWLHTLEHASFFGTALLFWRALLDARFGARIGPALAAAFATLMHGGLLGALITMAPRPLFSWYVGRAELWGLTALDDQQLAGLLMWVPLGVVYFGACLVLAARLVATEARQVPHSSAVDASPNLRVGSATVEDEQNRPAALARPAS